MKETQDRIVRKKLPDRIVQEDAFQIVSYMGFGDAGGERKKKRGSPMYLRGKSEVRT